MRQKVIDNTPGKRSLTPDGSTRLTSIQRRPEGLFAVLLARSKPFEHPKPNKINEGIIPVIADESPYHEETLPLEDVPAVLFPEKAQLIRSWDELRTVATLNGEVAASVLRILADTILVPDGETYDINIQVPDEPQPPFRATAAHPRAFRGTKYKPPKAAKPETVNLQPSLCSALEEGRLLARLEPYLEDGARLLGPVSRSCKPMSPDHLLTSRCFKDVFSAEHRKRVASLPAPFLRDLFWNVRTCDWETIFALLSDYWALELGEKPQLRSCVSYLLGEAAASRAIAWLRVISRIPPERRTSFTELLIETGAFRTEPDEKIAMGLARADGLCADEFYRHRMHYALKCVSADCGLDYANDGFLLANRYYPDYSFDEVSSLVGAYDAVEPFAEYVRDAEEWWGGTPLSKWKRCSELDGFRDTLRQLRWRELDPASALKFVIILGDVVYEDLREKKRNGKWRCIRKWASHILEALLPIEPEYRHKALDGVGSLLWVLEEPKELDSAVKPFCTLLARLCARPFRKHSYADYSLAAFTSLPAEDWAIIETAGDASFVALESESARKNDASLIGRALWTMCDILPHLTATTFAHNPKQLLKAAHTLGVLEVPTRREVVKAFASHPLVTCDITDLSVEALVALVGKHLKEGIADPVPKRVREQLKGNRELKPAQVERDLARIRHDWPALQLDVLNQTAYDSLSSGLPSAQRTGTVRHALMIQQVAEENRRSLRRLLKSALSGHRGYVPQHPLNLMWLTKHPRIDPARWTSGMTFRAETKDFGMLDLSIEQDPLEVLRLGSYFGTCLGVGGICSYSAAAVTLDINKQVVYARSATGRVVARQLLAIAEDDRLVCFEVYPTGIRNEVKKLFREFDLVFARHLGIDICKGESEPDGESYEIASNVSRGFWDDSAWDLEITDE